MLLDRSSTLRYPEACTFLLLFRGNTTVPESKVHPNLRMTKRALLCFPIFLCGRNGFSCCKLFFACKLSPLGGLQKRNEHIPNYLHYIHNATFSYYPSQLWRLEKKNEHIQNPCILSTELHILFNHEVLRTRNEHIQNPCILLTELHSCPQISSMGLSRNN